MTAQTARHRARAGDHRDNQSKGSGSAEEEPNEWFPANTSVLRTLKPCEIRHTATKGREGQANWPVKKLAQRSQNLS